MEKMMPCPICGNSNKRIWHAESVGVVEDHYICTNCGYFREMAYSPVLEGIAVPEGMDPQEHNKLYGETINLMKIKVYDSTILDYI